MAHARSGLDVFITCLLLCLCALPGPIFAQTGGGDEVEDQSSFMYGELSHKGPQNWARLNPNWTVCGIGKLQSPIDLVDSRVVILPTLGNIIRLYKPAPAVIKNRGHDITLQWQGDAGGVMINRTLYNLLQCHWHSPSEHTVDGKRYQMEIHLVHKDARGNLAVIGILYRLGRPDPFLGSLLQTLRVNDANATRTLRGRKGVRTNNEIGILRSMRPLNQNGTRNASAVNPNGTMMGVVDPWGIRFGSRQYLRYIGSLTTPPCTEGVLWTVLQKVKTVSRRQMRALRTAVADGFENNARPIQHYENPVYMYRPEIP